jgi:hypothetical protein
MMKAADATRVILNGVERNQPVIAFSTSPLPGSYGKAAVTGLPRPKR